jgi:exodeoxyribonuclease V alpha subunit
MQVENNYDKEVYNGDLASWRASIWRKAKLAVDIEGREVTYGFGELDELVLAYAIHKSQGSECPAVVMMVSS